MAITVGSFTLTPTSGVQTQINADLEFDEATIYFGTSSSNNASAVDFYINGESHAIPFNPGEKYILEGVGGEELNFNQFDIKTAAGGDGITVQYQVHNPYGS